MNKKLPSFFLKPLFWSFYLLLLCPFLKVMAQDSLVVSGGAQIITNIKNDEPIIVKASPKSPIKKKYRRTKQKLIAKTKPRPIQSPVDSNKYIPANEGSSQFAISKNTAVVLIPGSSFAAILFTGKNISFLTNRLDKRELLLYDNFIKIECSKGFFCRPPPNNMI